MNESWEFVGGSEELLALLSTFWWMFKGGGRRVDLAPLMSTTGFTASTASRRSLEVSLAALIAVGVLLTFWSQQRYPALLKKLHAGGAIKVAGPISFDTL